MDDERMSRKRISIKLTMVQILAVTILLFGILLMGIFRVVKGIVTGISSEYIRITSQKLETELEILYDKMWTYSMNLSCEDCVKMLLTDADSQRVRHVNELKDVLAFYTSLEPSITDIAIVNDHIHYSGIFNEAELDAIYQKSDLSGFTWMGTRFSSFPTRKNQAQLLYSMPIFDGKECIGELILSISTSIMNLSGEDMENALYMLADENGIIYSFGTDELSQHVWESWKELSFQSGEKNGYRINSGYSEKMKCWQVSAMDQTQISSEIQIVKILIYSAVAMVVILAGFVLWILFRKLVLPLSRFQKHIEEITNSSHPSAYESGTIGGCAEIQTIGEAFDRLMIEQKKLNRRIFNTAADLYEAKIQKQQAELSYMRSQIDPHFLYNTLETVRKMALVEGADSVADMAVDMGKIFRYSTKGDSMVALREELEMIRSYLHIQQMRFGDRIHVFYSVTEEAASCMIVKMLMQPCVENAIIHGLEPKEQPGSLFIAAKTEEGQLVLTIKDDGVGICPERLQEICSGLEQEIYDTSKHVGILNTQARIRLRYGRAYGISVQSRLGDGTTVTIRVPAERKDDV